MKRIYFDLKNNILFIVVFKRFKSLYRFKVYLNSESDKNITSEDLNRFSSCVSLREVDRRKADVKKVKKLLAIYHDEKTPQNFSFLPCKNENLKIKSRA